MSDKSTGLAGGEKKLDTSLSGINALIAAYNSALNTAIPALLKKTPEHLEEVLATIKAAEISESNNKQVQAVVQAKAVVAAAIKEERGEGLGL